MEMLALIQQWYNGEPLKCLKLENLKDVKRR
jgi:hypothetical protein